MEGAVDDEEPHVRPGLGHLPAYPRQLVPPLLPELWVGLCAEPDNTQLHCLNDYPWATIYLITVSVELWSSNIGVSMCG